MNIIRRFLSWLRQGSFYRTKVVLFSALVTGIMFDMFFTVDLRELTLEYGNNTSSPIVLIGLILTCIVFISLDFWLERSKSNERTNKELLDAIRDPNVPEEIKRDILDIIRSRT